MVQEMNILRCYSCRMFQVHIVKKANKWKCKICNEKQSVQHVYYQGTGEDCRHQVQRLNFLGHTKEEQQVSEASENVEDVGETHDSLVEPVVAYSKWDKYMNPKKEWDQILPSYDQAGEKLVLARSEREEHVIPQRGDCGIGLSANKDIDISSESPKSTSKGPKTLQEDVTTSEAYCLDEKLMNEEELRGLLLLDQNFTTRESDQDNEGVPVFEKKRFPSSGREEENDVSSLTISHSSNNRKHEKRKGADIENIVPRSDPNSFPNRKRSKLFDETLSRKRTLRDIVESNRSNAALKTHEKIVQNNSSIRNDGESSVSKSIEDIPDTNIHEKEISVTNAKRKTIFETDSDDLDDTLDF